MSTAPEPRRQPQGLPADFRLAGKIVKPSLNRVVRADATLQLEPKIMQVLVALAERPGEVVTRERLFRDVWEGAYVTEDVLTRAVGELRRVFEDDPAQPRVIETIRKTGYRLLLAPEGIPPESVLEPASSGRGSCFRGRRTGSGFRSRQRRGSGSSSPPRWRFSAVERGFAPRGRARRCGSVRWRARRGSSGIPLCLRTGLASRSHGTAAPATPCRSTCSSSIPERRSG